MVRPRPRPTARADTTTRACRMEGRMASPFPGSGNVFPENRASGARCAIRRENWTGSGSLLRLGRWTLHELCVEGDGDHVLVAGEVLFVLGGEGASDRVLGHHAGRVRRIGEARHPEVLRAQGGVVDDLEDGLALRVDAE